MAVADDVLFTRWISDRQHPANCTAVEGAPAPRHDYFMDKIGFGAQLVSLKFGLLSALLSGRVYHLPRSHYVNPRACRSQSLTCYFEAPTDCAAGEHRLLHTEPHHWCADTPRHRLSRLAGLRAVHSARWYHAQLTAYLLRPNARTRAVRDAVRRNLTWSGDGSTPAPGPTSPVGTAPSAAAAFRASMCTVAPAAASASAMARPIPEAAPVTTADLLASEKGIVRARLC